MSQRSSPGLRHTSTSSFPIRRFADSNFSLSSRFITLILVTAALACDSERGPATTAAIRDSAGVEIIEYPSDAAPPARWHLSETPEVEIGVLEGDQNYQLFRVFAGARLSDGRIVIVNAGTHELRYYDASGRFIEAVGGEGGGPGEFNNLGWMTVFAGDSVITWDWGNARLSIFDGEGGFVRSAKLESQVGRFPFPEGRFDDGTVLVAARSGFGPDATPGVHRDSTLYFRFATDGALVDTVGTFSGNELFVDTFGRGLTVTSLAFGRNTYVEPLGDELLVANNEAYELQIHDRRGALLRLIRRQHEAAPVTADDIERSKQQQLDGAPDPDWRSRFEVILEKMPYPERKPHYSGVSVDRARNIWVSELPASEEAGPSWTIFAPDGRLLATLEAPEPMALLDIGDDYLLSIQRDDLDVERVRLYGLVRP